MSADKTILIISPGATSTRIGIFSAGKMKVNVSVKHPDDELRKFRNIWDQYDYRREAVFLVLRQGGFTMDEMDAIACRLGNVDPLPVGTYQVCARMIADMKSGIYGGHPPNVGGLVAYDLGDQFNIPVITTAPPMTDESRTVEMEALAVAAVRCLNHEQELSTYVGSGTVQCQV